MALSITTQDLENYPGVTKTVSLDLSSVVPIGYEGDEKIVLNVSTNAYSNNTSRTAIQDRYITGFKAGWCKSSGLTGSGGKFAVDADHYKLKVKIDATISGSDGSGYYEIALASSSTPTSGEIIAEDMEEKIRALGENLNPIDAGFALSYKTAIVEYKNDKFWIVSGSLGNSYTGAYRTAVEVVEADDHDASSVLGFDRAITSKGIADIIPKDTKLSTNYTAGTDTLEIVTGTGVTAGDCMMITDGSNTDYFTAISGTVGDTSIKVATTATNGFDGITNSYTVVGTKVQLLREQDPDGVPSNYYSSFDSVARQGIKLIMSQIDYSS